MKNIAFKKIGIVLVAVLLLMQFVRPARTNSANAPAKTSNDISHVVNIPADVQEILNTSCYDCHSNHTNYPWYTNIQPIGLWLDNHVKEGVDELNFSEFANYKHKRQLHKLDEIAEMIKAQEMPLASYTFIHRNARLSEAQAELLINWALHSKEMLSDTSAIAGHATPN